MTMTPDQFHELLDDAMDPPAAPSVDSIVHAGRTRLRRRRATRAGAGLATLLALFGVGITLHQPTGQTPLVANDPARTPTAQPAPPTVLSDVVDAAFTTPGEAASRNIRVQTFLRSWSITACGGTGEPLDSTAMRFEQNLLPNLDLIREKGFSEPINESFAGSRKDCDTAAELAAAAPTWTAWSALSGEWHDTVETTIDDLSLAALLPNAAQCLEDKTGRTIDRRDPIDSFFDDEDSMAISQTDAVAYADCTAGYFGQLETRLLAERPTFVETNEQVLAQFASELSAMGYTA